MKTNTKIKEILQDSALKSTGAPATSRGGDACFWTSWAWNQDTALLCSIQGCAVNTQTQPLVEHTPTGQCTQTRELTCVIGHVHTCLHLWNFTTWRFVCRELAVCPNSLYSDAQTVPSCWPWSPLPESRWSGAGSFGFCFPTGAGCLDLGEWAGRAGSWLFQSCSASW